MNKLTGQRGMPAAEKIIYTVRLGSGAGSGVPGPSFLHMCEHFRSFIPGRAGIFYTNRDPPFLIQSGSLPNKQNFFNT